MLQTDAAIWIQFPNRSLGKLVTIRDYVSFSTGVMQSSLFWTIFLWVSRLFFFLAMSDKIAINLKIEPIIIIAAPFCPVFKSLCKIYVLTNLAHAEYF